MASPRPKPVEGAPSRLNRSKTRSRMVAGIPGPSSLTVTRTHSGRAVTAISTCSPPCRSALSSRLSKTRPVRSGSPSAVAGASRRASRRSAPLWATMARSAARRAARAMSNRMVAGLSVPASARASARSTSTSRPSRRASSSTISSAPRYSSALRSRRSVTWTSPSMAVSGVRSSCAALALKAFACAVAWACARRSSFVTWASSSHSSPMPRTGSSSSPSPRSARLARAAASCMGARARPASQSPKSPAPTTAMGDTSSMAMPSFFPSWRSSPTQPWAWAAFPVKLTRSLWSWTKMAMAVAVPKKRTVPRTAAAKAAASRSRRVRIQITSRASARSRLRGPCG